VVAWAVDMLNQMSFVPVKSYCMPRTKKQAMPYDDAVLIIASIRVQNVLFSVIVSDPVVIFPGVPLTVIG
jgi:hypothetical protein